MKDAAKYQEQLIALANIFKKAGVFATLDSLAYLGDKTYEQVLADVVAQYRRMQIMGQDGK